MPHAQASGFGIQKQLGAPLTTDHAGILEIVLSRNTIKKFSMWCCDDQCFLLATNKTDFEQLLHDNTALERICAGVHPSSEVFAQICYCALLNKIPSFQG
jgi:hypothetical protein